MSVELIVGIVGTAVGAVTACGTAAMVLFHGGRQVGRVEAAISRLTGIEEKLKKVIDHDVDIGILKDSYERMRSDHKRLAAKVEGTAEETAEMRGRFESVHEK
jgi:hypothetical protein